MNKARQEFSDQIQILQDRLEPNENAKGSLRLPVHSKAPVSFALRDG